MPYEKFKRTVRAYYRKYGRELPWRKTRNPYRVLVSEFMLQQTQVARVLRYYPDFIRQFPTARTLARAPFSRVLAAWRGLGYNRRALMLHRLSRAVVKDHGGKIPKQAGALLTLPGIGNSTAGGVLAFAYNIPHPFIETNIRRVFIHFFFKNKKHVHDRDILTLVEKTMDRKNPREWYWALMDYGAMLAELPVNPNKKSVHYARQPAFRGSNRELRGKILYLLLTSGGMTADEITRSVSFAKARVLHILPMLSSEGFLVKKGNLYRIPGK